MTLRLDRRHLLALGGVAALAGCTGDSTTTSRTTAPASTGSLSSARSTAPSTAPSPSSPRSSTAVSATESPTSAAPSATANGVARPAWTPDANDVAPEVKLLAAHYVETTVAQPAVQVVFSQYGGILATTASVLVVTRPYPAVTDPATGSTFDVRLVRSGGIWRVTEIHPSTPGARSGSLTSSAMRVLTSTRIDLPPASRADIASGQVHDSVLRALLILSETFEVGVSVVRSGHPVYVFGTSRLSDHPRGRAFDAWRLNGQPVVSASTPRSLVTTYMQAAAGAGSYNVGGPYQLSGSTFFSDSTHHDHVHAGFST
ncbi:MAG: hypothetical protein ABI083_09525 [Lapillicoccus sp.]